MTALAIPKFRIMPSEPKTITINQNTVFGWAAVMAVVSVITFAVTVNIRSMGNTERLDKIDTKFERFGQEYISKETFNLQMENLSLQLENLDTKFDQVIKK